MVVFVMQTEQDGCTSLEHADRRYGRDVFCLVKRAVSLSAHHPARARARSRMRASSPTSRASASLASSAARVGFPVFT